MDWVEKENCFSLIFSNDGEGERNSWVSSCLCWDTCLAIFLLRYFSFFEIGSYVFQGGLKFAMWLEDDHDPKYPLTTLDLFTFRKQTQGFVYASHHSVNWATTPNFLPLEYMSPIFL